MKTKFEQARNFVKRRKRYFDNQRSDLELNYFARVMENMDRFSPNRVPVAVDNE
jgi:hypothetical protein